MSTTHLSREQIYEWVDGERDPDVDRHLADCLSCRRRVGEVERLLDSLASMPEEVDPPDWVWDGLLDRVREDEGSPKAGFAPDRRRREAGGGLRLHLPGLYRAAAVLVLAGGAVLAIRRHRTSPTVPQPARAVAGATAAFQASLEAYERTSATLDRTFQERAAELPPDTRAALARSLAELDRAITGVRRALAEQPDEPRLQARLSRTYQWKVKILERAVRLTTEL